MSKITEQDLEGLNTYGFKYELDEHGYMFIDLSHAKIMVHKRNWYCDRGRYGFSVEVKREHLDKMSIDWADGFPRYFFKLQRAFDELEDWINFNKEKIGLEENAIEKI